MDYPETLQLVEYALKVASRDFEDARTALQCFESRQERDEAFAAAVGSALDRAGFRITRKPQGGKRAEAKG